MKLRIKGNSIRFRLSKADVSKFIDSKFIEESTSFMKNKLIYRIENSPIAFKIESSFIDSTIRITIPSQISDRWTQSQEVGIYYDDTVDNEGTLKIIIEKDFKCLDETNEDQSDNYENPLANKLK